MCCGNTRILHTSCVKCLGLPADICKDMIISEEQVRRAVEYLHTSEGDDVAAIDRACEASVSPELLEKVQAVCAELPDTRDERVEHARGMIEGRQLTSSEVAEKMIGRIISDSLR